MNEKQFLSALTSLRTSKREDVSVVDKRFKAALLAFGSETEDNMSCVEEIKFAELPQDGSKTVRGLTLKTSGILVSDVLHYAEGCSIPEPVKAEFPEISQEEWDAVLRLVVLVLLAVECWYTPAR